MVQLIGTLIGIVIIWNIVVYVFDLLSRALSAVYAMALAALPWVIGTFVLYAIYKAGGYFITWFQIMLRHIILTVLAIVAECYLFSTAPELIVGGSIVIFICYVFLVIAAEKRAAYSEISDKLKASFDRIKIIPISGINMYKPYWTNKEDRIKESCTPPDTPQKIADSWVSEGKLQKKVLWDKIEYYYQDEEFIQNMYQETISMAVSCVDPLLNEKGVYFDTMHIKQLDEYINSEVGDSSIPRLKRVILENYLADKNLYIGDISIGNKVYINVQVVKEKLASAAESCFFDISQIVNNAGEYSKDILQGIMTNVHVALPGFSYLMLKEGGGTLWVQSDYEALFTCAACGEYSQTIQAYGPKRYCADCLEKIHAKEDADENAEKEVKRYIDAPPPGVVIRGGAEADNVALPIGEEEE